MKNKPVKKRKRHKNKVGMSPGSLVYTGAHKSDEPDITLIRYNSDEVLTEKINSGAFSKVVEAEYGGVKWINIDGLHDVSIIEKIGKHLGLHKLTLEDILNVNQRPKIDDQGESLFVVLKMFTPGEDPGMPDREQVSFVLKDNILVTFQERSGDVFDHVRTRLQNKEGNLRRKGGDYLLYALMDIIIDYYYPILEETGEELEMLEVELLDHSSDVELSRLHSLRRRLLEIRRSVYPLREVVSRLEKSDNTFIHPDTRIFVRDLYEHTIQVIETVEVFRDMASGVLDLYMNVVSNRMNSIMKVLTIIGTVFLPLTFIVGVYGMNFEYMPELEWKWGYFGIMTFMIVIVIGMLIYFKRRKWI